MSSGCTTVTPGELHSRLADHPELQVLDVRSRSEFENSSIAGAQNVPLDRLGHHAARLAQAGPMVVVCQSGARAGKAGLRLAGAGAEGIEVLDGGMQAWQAAGGAVTVGRPRWSLERQVRLVAGSLIVAGVLTSVRWHPAVALPGMVGSGLVFAALTDTCTMGEVLAKLPYNRGSRGEIEQAVQRLTS